MHDDDDWPGGETASVPMCQRVISENRLLAKNLKWAISVQNDVKIT